MNKDNQDQKTGEGDAPRETLAEATVLKVQWRNTAIRWGQQRDELLEAAKAAVSKMQEAGIGFGETELRAAISKAEMAP